jgi:hypothetical protein
MLLMAPNKEDPAAAKPWRFRPYYQQSPGGLGLTAAAKPWRFRPYCGSKALEV